MNEEYKELREQAVNSFLSVLTEGGVITESTAKRIPALAEIEYGKVSGVVLSESINPQDPSPQKISFYGNERIITIENVFGAWDNLKNVTAAQLVTDLFKIPSVDGRKHAGSMFKSLMEWYNISIKKSNPNQLPPIPMDLKDRKNICNFGTSNAFTSYTEMWNAGLFSYDPSGTFAVFNKDGLDDRSNRTNQKDDYTDGVLNQQVFHGDEQVNYGYRKADNPIDRGQRGQDHSRAGRTAQKINDMDLMAGELYTNISRIPRPAASRWANLFKKEVQRFGLSPDKKRTGFKSVEWKKVFIMGYQIEERTLFEIWYNTIDSSYTLHDYVGNTIGKRYPTMNEAVRRLMFAAVKFSPDDVEFFKNPANRSIADSFFRPLISSTDEYVKDMSAREQALYNKEQEELAVMRSTREETKKADEEAARERAKRRQERGEELRGKVKSAASRGFASVKSAAASGASSTASAAKPYMSAAQQAVKDRIEKEREDIQSLMRGGRTYSTSDDDTPVPYQNIAPVRPSARDWDGYSKDVKYVFDVGLNAKSNRPNIAESLYKQGKLSEEDVKIAKGLLLMIAEFNMAARQGESVISHHLRSHDTIDELPRDVLDRVRKAYNVPTMSEKQRLRDGERAKNANSEPEQLGMFESTDFLSHAERMNELGAQFDDAVNDPQFQRQMDNSREMARRESATFKMIQKMVMGSITKYYDTQLKPNMINNMISKYLGKHAINKGIYNKVRKFFMGQTERADFQVGYSIDDRVFYEVWLITQANPDYDGDKVLNKTIAGLYLFDVTSGTPKLIRGSMPYLRNAEQALLQVAGVVG
jgi:hypothetical protein